MPSVVLKFEKEMKMAVFEQWEEAWNKNDAAAWIALLHEDYQFKFHSNGKVMKKSDMTLEMMTAAMTNESVTNRRCLYEIDDICVIHQFNDFENGDKEAVMSVTLKKDGLFWRTETGATPLK